MKSTVAFSAPHGLIIGPEKGSTDFTLLTNGILLASGHAPFHRGLEFEIDGNGREGELLIVLAENPGSVKSEQEFSYTLKYDRPGNVTRLHGDNSPAQIFRHNADSF